MSGEVLNEALQVDSMPKLLIPSNTIWSFLGSCRTSMYGKQVYEFSLRTFTDLRDVLWAFLGVLKPQTRHFPRGFIWGVPYERLDATLLWSETLPCNNSHMRNLYHSMVLGKRRYQTPYPSWSWLSTNTQINFVSLCGSTIVSRVTWHEPFKLADDNDM